MTGVRGDGGDGGRAAPLPDHRYVPGRTARHPEGAFDWIRDQAPAETLGAGARANAPWRYGLRLLNAGFYWEAHEVLEPVWMNAAPNSVERAATQAVIQLANAALKRDMGKPRAALRLCAIAEDHGRDAGAGPVMGLSPTDVFAAIDHVRRTADAGESPAGAIGLDLHDEL